jgi:putative SOS response-associated peptidase YedK
MCGRFTQERPTSELAEIFEAEDLAQDPGGRFNVAPTDESAVLVQRDDRRAIVAYRWGLIPHSATDAKAGSRMFNARAETLNSSPAYRAAVRRRRCVVPVDSFYEWRVEDGVRQPYRIHRPDGQPLPLAGLWAGWRDPETGEVRRTFSIVTTTPNDVVAELHDRMPVILDDDSWRRWVAPTTELGELSGLLGPAPDGFLAAYRVNRLVNNVRNDGPALIEALTA